jgi:glycosyltransferase involved in cell wall biosynthesis
MEHQPKFSVIVPAFNSSAFIENGLKSVYNQSFKDYELIVVCDSCTDNTKEIAEKYGAITYEVNFHQDGQTRNVGLDHAKGEWILFLDDDDRFLHEFVFEMLAANVGKHGEDILMFSSIWARAGYARNTKDKILISVWNKCWKREAIGDTRFSNEKYISDLAFHEAMMKKEPKAIIWDQPFYYHDHMREGSQTDEQKKLGLI